MSEHGSRGTASFYFFFILSLQGGQFSAIKRRRYTFDSLQPTRDSAHSRSELSARCPSNVRIEMFCQLSERSSLKTARHLPSKMWNMEEAVAVFSLEPNKGRIRLSALSSGLDELKGLPPSIFESVARPPIIALRIWNDGGRAEIYQDFTAIWRAAAGGGGGPRARQMKSKIGVLQERRRSGPQKIDPRKEDAHFITKEAAAMLLR